MVNSGVGLELGSFRIILHRRSSASLRRGDGRGRSGVVA